MLTVVTMTTINTELLDRVVSNPLLLSSREILGSNLDPETRYPEVLRGFSLQTNAEIGYRIRPQPLLSRSLQIH